MDLNALLGHHQRALMLSDHAATEPERNAHRQFVRDYSVRIRMFRNEMGAADAVFGFPT